MKLEDQLSSLAPSQRLKELGVKQESVFYWLKTTEGNMEISVRLPGHDATKIIEAHLKDEGGCSAFTVAELGEMLPEDVTYAKNFNGFIGWTCGFWKNPPDGSFNESRSNTEANARTAMLIYLLEQGLVKP